MLIRYKINEQGKQIAIAKIYTQEEHQIHPKGVDQDSRFIIERLKTNGFEGYIVGGAVRDLLLDKTPKDFDIATNASPKQLRKIFWNSRVIGRRFKLVHIYFQEKIFEVSTFRSSEADAVEGNNVYGTIEEDAQRRDFTINGLYFDPVAKQILDFNDSYKDIKNRRMRSIIPLNKTFVEDPVRMIRCVKYAMSIDFTVPFLLDRAIKKHADELKRCSSSRMTEEIFKILQSGASRDIVERLIHYKMFIWMLPEISGFIQHGRNKILTQQMYDSLAMLDSVIAKHEHVTRARMLAGLVDPFITIPAEYENSTLLFRSIFKQIKEVIAPITPPNYEVERAVEYFFKQEGLKVPKNAVRKPLTAQQRKKSQQHRRRPAGRTGSQKRRTAKSDTKTEK
jgi:poly(A) polymerase